MAWDRAETEGSRPPRRSILGRVGSFIFGGQSEPLFEPADPSPKPEEERPIETETASQWDESQPQSAARAVEVLERALGHFESVLGTLEERAAHSELAGQVSSELSAELLGVLARVEEALGRLGGDAQRLSDEASNLAQVAGRLEGRVGELTSSVSHQQLAAPAAPELEPYHEPEPVAPAEPQFRPGDQPVGIVVAAVPGFQELMDVQRGMGALPSVARAPVVVGYKNGEASLEVALGQPVSAREIVEGLHASTGHQFVIEEARPEALRLRLRFVDGVGGISGGSLRLDLRPGAAPIG